MFARTDECTSLLLVALGRSMRSYNIHIHCLKFLGGPEPESLPCQKTNATECSHASTSNVHDSYLVSWVSLGGKSLRTRTSPYHPQMSCSWHGVFGVPTLVGSITLQCPRYPAPNEMAYFLLATRCCYFFQTIR
jgi:hypothetical protein